MSRKSSVKRKTRETDISVMLTLEGKGKGDIRTGIGFFDHMLETFAKHGGFDLKLSCKGDLSVDQHHTVEDCGIALGEAFDKALGDRKGINRAGFFAFPMDEALALCAIDIAGRPYLVFEASFKGEKAGGFPTDLVREFFQGFANSLRANVQVRGFNSFTDHHKIEAIFKAFAKAMRMACLTNSRMKDAIPSTKGVI
ncbi:TPA: imidazoleglycerol-phosphate dehydratase HisB [Candidatus Woesearchaeota archaeon]|nr:imidazoleglycerol-phosphate dehydratase HisB [Candidatus Woesearchaeota archaeon]HII69094.1 imidazoleglycerol-phosphate dehydratase HisB [Candidatus Woesearchaeota archaeon]